ncbi:hypothetical protein RZP54_08450 [Raoultella ornithinolytica]|uniref:hypothetical protein n=1 Tax=Raoultella ornithinolytica TaxID=54291 RepID=UPI000A2DEC05|nr:hypothetical protein [Raoultella ornithinolytica]EKV0506014.1 hypothetical protein [Raoultella ornithinolytica]EMF1899333.1 hypothetical protein [Raoultella ornithinolytica]MDV0589020.1 hypothetical protein [Raoultella ornithinolytica]PQH15865.1 hypothetical protein C5T92_07410 [Raoultella ornithinolytica]PQH38834.1 hypothetical protein C5T94_04420 [Raoultella ornithinolytica]
MINAAGDNAFDIHEKLKKHGAKWLYMHEENSHQINTNYEFCTNFIGEIEFAIYERHGNHFILVDFFKSYDEACDEAKDILYIYPEIRVLILKATSISSP